MNLILQMISYFSAVYIRWRNSADWNGKFVLNSLSKFDGYMAMLMTLMVVMMKMVVLVAVMAGILSFSILGKCKGNSSWGVLSFLWRWTSWSCDHDGHSAEDEDQRTKMTNDQRKTIRIQKALRFPNGKFWDGLQIFGTARKENFFKAVQHFQTLRIIGQKNLFIIWKSKKTVAIMNTKVQRKL